MPSKLPSRTILTGLVLLCLTACAAPLPKVVETDRLVALPATLTADCPSPGLEGIQTNGDMAERLVAYDQSLASCNADKASIRAIQEGAANGAVPIQ